MKTSRGNSSFRNPTSPETVGQIVNKKEFYELCALHGIEYPGLWSWRGGEEFESLAGRIEYPCIFKPSLIHKVKKLMKGQKVLLANSAKDFRDVASRIPVDSGEWLIQEVVPGPESNIYLVACYMNRAGEPVQTFTARKLRQHPPGFGSASLASSELYEPVREASVRFLKSIGYRGICGTEFKLDPRDGRLKMIEMNPRPTLWFHLSHSAGKRVSETAYLDLTGREYSPQRAQDENVVWKYALKDLYSALFYWKNGRNFIFPPPETVADHAGSRKRCWAVYSTDDPLPALVEPLQYLKKLSRGVS